MSSVNARLLNLYEDNNSKDETESSSDGVYQPTASASNQQIRPLIIKGAKHKVFNSRKGDSSDIQHQYGTEVIMTLQERNESLKLLVMAHRQRKIDEAKRELEAKAAAEAEPEPKPEMKTSFFRKICNFFSRNEMKKTPRDDEDVEMSLMSGE